MKELKAHWQKYGVGAIVGAVLILILGFAIGPLTTNGSAEELAGEAARRRRPGRSCPLAAGRAGGSRPNREPGTTPRTA